MEQFKLTIFGENSQYYKDFLLKLTLLKEQLKRNNKYQDIFESLDSIESKKIYFMILFFQNHDNWLNINFRNIYNNKDTSFKIKTISDDSNNNNNYKYIFNMIILWLCYLYLELTKNISCSGINRTEINRKTYLFRETNLLLIKLYKSNIFNTGLIVNVLKFLFILCESNFGKTTCSDDLYMLKNYLLLKEFFFLFQEITTIILNNINKNINNKNDENNIKNDIQKIFMILEDLKNNKEINSERNMIIIINYHFLDDFICSFLKTTNAETMCKYEPTFKNKLIDVYSHFIKLNYKKTNIFDKLLGFLKNSFKNLYYFEKNKEKILHDLFIQGFYLKLIKKLFFIDEKNLNTISIPPFNSFFFNGYNSEISLNLQSNKFLEKSSLFFSFNVVTKNNKEKYPLFSVDKDIKKEPFNKELLFEIYLKKINKTGTKNNLEEYDLYLYKDNTDIKIDHRKKITSNTTYYFNITFNVNKLYISFYNGKDDIEKFEIDKKKKIFDSNSFNLTFGHERFENKELNSFSGYIGPIIMIKNPSNIKEIKYLHDLISVILKMKYFYQYFIFLEPNSSYSFEYINHYRENNVFNNAKKKLENINCFECFLYLTPDLLSFYNESPSEKDKTIPDIGIICQNQKDYKINNLNVTLVRHEKGIDNFNKDNGLDYICLLYEYIYQFMRNYIENENSIIEYKDLYKKMIISLLKKSLYILENNELNINNFNKSFKHIYMNLFSCIKIITQKYYIMNDLIDYFFIIITNYRPSIFNLISRKNSYSKNIEINDENYKNIDNLLKVKLSFLCGWIDFVLTPDLYDFKNSRVLKKLFDILSSCFNFQRENEASVLINQYFYFKLKNFAPFLSSYYEKHELNNENNINNERDNTNKKLEENNNINDKDNIEVLQCYLKVLGSFFENNPSKAENISNLKEIFQFIYEYLEDNYSASLIYYDFINEIIEADPDLYFNDEKDDEEIRELISYSKQLSKKIAFELKDVKDENKINNRKSLFNKLISIIMRIIFTKKRTNNNAEIIDEFKNLIQKVEITSDLIEAITSEICNIINYSIGASKNNKKSKQAFSDKNENQEKKEKYYTSEELKYISNFYSEIFNLILYFLEYPVNNSNINNIKELDIYEEKVFKLLEWIHGMIDGNFNNNVTIDINCKNEFNEDDNGMITVDTIYCLIYYVKFYNTILFKRLYEKKYIENFINVCKLCNKICLINSNILVELGGFSKTILEIILDICLHYITHSSRQFYDPLPIDEINLVRSESILYEQSKIYEFLISLLPNSESHDKKKKNSIFYNNDYLRLLSNNMKDLKKKSKKIQEYPKEFYNYKIINNLLMNEQKFNYNFSTFFLIKIDAYLRILNDLDMKLNKLIPSAKEILMINSLLKLVKKTKDLIYLEHNDLSTLNRDFFFKKANSSKYNYYTEIKKRIENFLKKKDKDKDQSQIDDFLKQIYEDNSDDIFNSINSGLCCKKQNSNSFSFNSLMSYKRSEDETINNNRRKKGYLYQGGHLALSSNNLINNYKKHKFEEKDEIDSFSKGKSKTILINSCDDDNNIASSSQEDDELQLAFREESPSFGSIKEKNIASYESSKNDNLSPPPPEIKRDFNRQKTVNFPNHPIKNFDIIDNKKSKGLNSERRKSLRSQSSTESSMAINNLNNILTSYINYFNEPDECFLKNAKKELMMTAFSLHFFDAFFFNNEFELMKTYYLQNFEGIQTFTKMLDYPSKCKNFSNGLDPPLFLKPFTAFFGTKIFPITHRYFYDYMSNNNISPEPILLYQKDLPLFTLKNQIKQNCELIKTDRHYYGTIIGSKDYNFIIFEEKKYEFYEENNNIINKNQINLQDLDDLFTISIIAEKPLGQHQIKILKKVEELSNFKGKKTKGKKMIIILFSEIEEILERRFLFMWQAIEIYLKNGKSYYFNFLSLDKCKNILDIFKNNNITKDKIHEKDYFKKQEKISTEWSEKRLSTYEYLLFINKYSSRTFNDPNQYPIFPWLINKYSNNMNDSEFRIMKYPMGAQSEETRTNALNHYEDDEGNRGKFPSHFGTHYSTSAYIYYYLMREEPYTTLLVKLQGYKQENPDRMFYSIENILSTLASGHDNREMIPELYNKIEHFINLNCVNFGLKNSNLRVDDFNIVESNNNKYSEISKYVKYLTNNRKLLEENQIVDNINEWIDNIFGIGQLPEKNRKKSLNIFSRETYEKNVNFHEKMTKYIKKQNKNEITTEKIIKKITNKINLIIAFGQTPYQIFNYQHPRYGKNTSNNEGDFEYDLHHGVWDKNANLKIDFDPIFFTIKYDSGLFFLINKERILKIIYSTLFDIKSTEKTNFIEYGKIELPQILPYDMQYMAKTKSFYYILKPIYSISIFKEKVLIDKLVNHTSKELDKISTSLGKVNDSDKNNNINYNNSNNNDYISYYNLYTKKVKLKNKHLNLESKKSKKDLTLFEDYYYKFVTCRYIDKSFKIHLIPKNKSNIIKDYIVMSYICEDFVTSCCAISSNKFLIGLKNGKLQQWSMEEVYDDIVSKKQSKPKINVKFNKQIQSHKKSINVIEFVHRLGIVITAGGDHYVFIRKIYDLELIVPIKFKTKYIITMAKVSPINFLYIMCFNKNKNKSVIFGYTLNGLLFAKSDYDYYETLNFTKTGNIVTWRHKKDIHILKSDDLKKIKMKEKDPNFTQFFQNQKKLFDSSWVDYSYFNRKDEHDSNIKIITYINSDKNKNKNIFHLSVNKIKYFD